MKTSLTLVLGLAAVLATAPAAGQSPPADASWISVPGSDTLVTTWVTPEGTFFAVSLDGGRTVAAARRADYRLMLRYARFDPQLGEPSVPAPLRAADDAGLHVVQYVTQALDGFRDAVRAEGGEVLHVVHNHANVVRMDAATSGRVRALPFVRAVVPLHPAYRLDERTLEELDAGTLTTRWYSVHVTLRGPAEKEAVRRHVFASGGVTDPPSPHGYLLRARLSPAQLIDVLHRPDVLFVDPWGPAEDDIDIARQLGGADHLECFTGFSGEGVRGEVMDSGLLASHPNLQTNPPIIHNSNGSSLSHGTSTYGEVFGDGVDNPLARGMLPDAQGVFASYTILSGFGGSVNRHAHTAELVDPNGPYRCVFQTNSWGSPRSTQYTTVSADMDDLLFDHDITICQSQSNAGDQMSRPQAWAKNIIACGGIRHQNTLTTADDVWSNGASIGPAADGRIKPDISSFYDNILTTSSSGGYTSTFGGTSGATPIVAGSAGLVYQMWASGVFGNSVGAGDVFDERCHMTTAKAILLANTSQYPFSGTNDDLTRVHQGWGRPDVRNVIDRAHRTFIVDETVVLTNLQTATYALTVPAGEPELRVCMTYADPPGNPAGTVHRINDLSLKVTSPASTVYWGNNGLLSSTMSSPGGSANTVDTVEQVIVANPAPGTWVVEVIASEVIQDGHVETGAIDADFALAAVGVIPPSAPPAEPGQANSAASTLIVGGGFNANNQPALPGINGPFDAGLSSGGTLKLTARGPANSDFLLLSGPLNANNLVLPGIGSIDIGLLGPNLSDVVVIMDGTMNGSLLNALANTGPNGERSLSFSLPALPPGILTALQLALIDASTSAVTMSAATQVTIN